MEGIIVGVDESQYAAVSLRWAVAHGAREQRPVTAVMAWGYIDQHHLEPGAPFDPGYSADVATKVVGQLVARALGEDHDVTCVAVNDLPARALLEAADGADLIVVGARGVGGFKGLLLGSVSRQILQGARCPVAIVRDEEGPGTPGAPVVVGIDGSGPAQRALAWAADHARRTGAPLHVIHAWHLPYIASTIVMPLPHPDSVAADADQFIQNQVARLETEGLEVRRQPVAGRAAAALVDASVGAAMVVVGSRGHGQLAAATLGSVSDQVSHHAHCPVVVVP